MTEVCQCSNSYECQHRCWYCSEFREDGCAEWCHIRPFDEETKMPEFIKSNYGSRITVQEEEDREILLALGDMTDVLISPEAALELADWLKKTAYRVLERVEDSRDQ